MFGNLYKEMKLKGITQTEICKYLGLTNHGFNKKIRGDTDFTSKEMFAIQGKFFPDKSLEYLFKKELKAE